MRLLQYITEGKTSEITLPKDYGEKDEKIVELIRTNCKPFLKQLSGSGNLMFRGVKIFNKDMLLVKPRKSRQPRDMPPEIQKTLDSYFQKKFGWKPRSTGVFGSGEFDQAMSYGEPYSMWPLGKFSILWSDQIDTGDLYVHIKRMRGRLPLGASLDSDLLQLVNTYKKGGLKKALKIRTEVMVQTNSYYLLNGEFTPLARARFLLPKKTLTFDKTTNTYK